MAQWFTLETSILELVVRASVVYFAVAVVIRLIPKRQAGNLSPNDILALVIIGGLASKAMEGESKSITEYLLMIGVLLFWGYALNLLERYFPRLRRIGQDAPTPLIQHGRMLRRNMEREMITEEELLACLRKQGVSDIAHVREAMLEVDGQISIVKHDQDGGGLA